MCEPFHVHIICDRTGNVNGPGMPCERQRHAERRDQIFDPRFLLYNHNAINVNNTMDDLGKAVIKSCMIAIVIIFAVVLIKSTLIACGVLTL